MANRKRGKLSWFLIGVIVGLLIPILYQAYKDGRAEEAPGSVGIVYLTPLYAAGSGKLDSTSRVGSPPHSEEALKWVWSTHRSGRLSR